MPDTSPTRFELWKLASGYTFFPESNADARELLEPGATLAWTVEAASWDEARAKMLSFIGRAPLRAIGGLGSGCPTGATGPGDPVRVGGSRAGTAVRAGDG
jgi:hypothetical protein